MYFGVLEHFIGILLPVGCDTLLKYSSNTPIAKINPRKTF